MKLQAARVSVKDAQLSTYWADGLNVKMSEKMWEQFPPDWKIESELRVARLKVALPESEKLVRGLREFAAYTLVKPTSSRLPISYQNVPAFLRAQIARVIGARQRRRQNSWAFFPSWPVDLSTDFLSDILEVPSRRFAKTPVMLSHDIDSLDGLKNSVAKFIDIEESFNARSTNYVVPCAWKIDHALLGELKRRGHPIGIHGYDHSNKTPFLSPAEITERVTAAIPLIERYDIRGYRAPSLLRTPNLLKALRSVYKYDSSIPTSGGAFPVPNNGCASARPYQVQGIWEIPLSMPRDGSLRFLGYKPKEILRIWIQCAELISKSGGIVFFLNHCEKHFSGNDEMLSVYRDFLSYIASNSNYYFTTAEELVASL